MTETAVNEENLEYWCKRIPECETFMHNFFGTCQSYDYRTNKENYEFDLALYAETEKWPLEALLLVFDDIAVDVRELN